MSAENIANVCLLERAVSIFLLSRLQEEIVYLHVDADLLSIFHHDKFLNSSLFAFPNIIRNRHNTIQFEEVWPARTSLQLENYLVHDL